MSIDDLQTFKRCKLYLFRQVTTKAEFCNLTVLWNGVERSMIEITVYWQITRCVCKATQHFYDSREMKLTRSLFMMFA